MSQPWAITQTDTSKCTFEKPGSICTDPPEKGGAGGTVWCNTKLNNNDYGKVPLYDATGSIPVTVPPKIQAPDGIWSCKSSTYDTEALALSRWGCNANGKCDTTTGGQMKADGTVIPPSTNPAAPAKGYYDPIPPGAISCSMHGINFNETLGGNVDPYSPGKKIPQVNDYIVYSRFGSWVNGKYTVAKPVGGWIYPDEKIQANVRLLSLKPDGKTYTSTDTTISALKTALGTWTYAYVPPGRPDIVDAIVPLGFLQPYGCMFEKSAFAKSTVPSSKESFGGKLGASSGNSPAASGGKCSSDVMKSLQSTCDKINKSKPKPPKRNMCAQMNEDNNKMKEKLKELQNNTPWYQSLIKTAGGIVDDLTTGGIIKNFGLAVHQAIGTDNKSVQQLNNALNISIDINQSQQAQAMCLNNASSVQTNSVNLTSCPNPYPDLITNVCGAPPCPKLCQKRTGTLDPVTNLRACESYTPGPSDQGTPYCPNSADYKSSGGKPAQFGPTSTACKNSINKYCKNAKDLVKCASDAENELSECFSYKKATEAASDLLIKAQDEYQKCIGGAGKSQREELTAAQAKFLEGQKSVVTSLDISQSSTNKVTQSCQQDIAQKALTNFAAGINNQVQQQISQMAKNMSASNTSDMGVCNDVNINMSACNYQSTQACCSNDANNTQTNTINMVTGCSPINGKIHQDLNNSVEQMCSQGVKQTEAAKGKAQISNKIQQAASQTAIGVDPMALFIIIVIVIAIICLSPVALTFIIGTKIILIMGIIIMLIGFGQFPAYFATKYSGGSRKNTPFVFTSRKEAKVKAFQQTTWKSAFEQYQQDDSIQGFDFFPDCLNLPNYGKSGAAGEVNDCSKDVAPGYESFPDAIQKGDQYSYPDNTPGKAIWYSTIAKSVKDGRSCITRGSLSPGTDDASKVQQAQIDGQDAGFMYNPYLCNIKEFKPPTDGSSTVTPVYDPPVDSKTPTAVPAACKSDATSDACLTPSVSYVKDYALSGWLISAIVTTIIGIGFLGVGIWIQTSGKSHQRPPIWRKNKTAPVNSFNSKCSKNTKMQQSKSTGSRRKTAK